MQMHAAAVFFGCMPFTLLCAQAGNVLSDVTDLHDLLSLRVVLQLAGVAILVLAPVAIKFVSRRWRLPPTKHKGVLNV
jgi:hypothetical protein